MYSKKKEERIKPKLFYTHNLLFKIKWTIFPPFNITLEDMDSFKIQLKDLHNFRYETFFFFFGLHWLYSMHLIKRWYSGFATNATGITKREKIHLQISKVSIQAYMVEAKKKKKSLKLFLPFHWNTQASLEHTLAFLARIYTAQRHAARSPPTAGCYGQKPAAPLGSARSVGRWHRGPDAWSSAWCTGDMRQSPRPRTIGYTWACDYSHIPTGLHQDCPSRLL